MAWTSRGKNWSTTDWHSTTSAWSSNIVQASFLMKLSCMFRPLGDCMATKNVLTTLKHWAQSSAPTEARTAKETTKMPKLLIFLFNDVWLSDALPPDLFTFYTQISRSESMLRRPYDYITNYTYFLVVFFYSTLVLLYKYLLIIFCDWRFVIFSTFDLDPPRSLYNL